MRSPPTAPWRRPGRPAATGTSRSTTGLFSGCSPARTAPPSLTRQVVTAKLRTATRARGFRQRRSWSSSAVTPLAKWSRCRGSCALLPAMPTLPRPARAPLAGRGGAARGCLTATPSSTRCARKASRWCEPSTTPVAGTTDASTVTTTGGRSSSQRGTGDVRATPSRFPNCGCGSRTPSHPGAASPSTPFPISAAAPRLTMRISSTSCRTPLCTGWLPVSTAAGVC